jgi:hypothetical protein
LGQRLLVQKKVAKGRVRHKARAGRIAGVGAVEIAVTVITESPLPMPICVGLKAKVVKAGAPEQEKVTLLGKVPVVGETSSV